MKKCSIALLVNLLGVSSFNENLRSVHYSVVTVGVDHENHAASYNYVCDKCITKVEGKDVKVTVDFDSPREFELKTTVEIEKAQNLRVKISVLDFIGSILGDSSNSHYELRLHLKYPDGAKSEVSKFSCPGKCASGRFQGPVDIKNTRTSSATLFVTGTMFNLDALTIQSMSFGDLILRSEIYEDGKGVVSKSCNGPVTSSVFFGKAGVGKSTIASMISSIPGLFEVGTSSHGTTTLGTWLSSSVNEGKYAQFAEKQFQPLGELPSIPSLNDLYPYYTNNTNLIFLDTEGLDYQTEFGDNYDVVTILPHTLISENVFLLVRDRVNPVEVMELIQKLAKAAEKANGYFTYRNEKLFGHFYIVVNKCQDVSHSDEYELEVLKRNNPSLIALIEEYFTHGPEVVLLPFLQWDYNDKPDFNEEGFYLDYDHIAVAHPPLRDRMFYGLHKIANYALVGVPTSSDYFFECSNYEGVLEDLYTATSEDVVDVNELDYEWQLIAAKEKLRSFVQKFDMDKTGLSTDMINNVCPEADDKLVNCFRSEVNKISDSFYNECLREIDIIFSKGQEDLQKFLDDDLFPLYVTNPIDAWFKTCKQQFRPSEEYTTKFLNSFEKCSFFTSCKQSVPGKFTWNNWEDCSRTCGGGMKVKMAATCVPSYSFCNGMHVQRQDCGMQACPNIEAEYQKALSAAKSELEKYVKSLDLDSLGLTNTLQMYVCREANEQVQLCFKTQTMVKVHEFRTSCGGFILDIMPEGRYDLMEYLDGTLMPKYLKGPIDEWFDYCKRQFSDVPMYSDQFLNYFMVCDFYDSCRQLLPGKLGWNGWESCTKTCGGGTQTRTSSPCVPEYAVCNKVQVERKSCNQQSCPTVRDTKVLPVGSIVPWVPKPNTNIDQTVSYKTYPGFIKCDGVEACSDGIFKGKKCTDMSGRGTMGSFGSYKVLNTYGGSIPSHHHSHTHGTDKHTHTTNSHAHTFSIGFGPSSVGTDKAGMGGSKSSKQHDHNLVGTTGGASDNTINYGKVNVVAQSNTPVTSIVDNKAALGELYPKHMRVYYIFKCF